MYTIRQMNNFYLKYEEIPKKLLDSFRTINLIYPDNLRIIEAYFFLMEFDEHSLSFQAKKFLFSINLLNSSLYTSLESNQNLSQLDNLSESRKNYCQTIDLKSIVTILNYAWGLFCHNPNEETLDEISLIKAAIERWLQSFATPKKMDVFLKIFNVAFGLSQTDR